MREAIGDAVHDNLRAFLEELYPYVIEKTGNGQVLMVPSLYQKISEHENFESLAFAVARDKELSKFFPALWENPDIGLSFDSVMSLQSIIVWSDGSSEGVTPLTLCAAIIGEVFRYLWSWKDDVSIDEALERLPDSIKLARTLAKKRPVTIPAVVSIHNIKLTRGRAVQVGRGILRQPIRYDKFRLMSLAITPGANALTLRLEIGFSAIHIRSISRDANAGEEGKKTNRLIETMGRKSMEQHARRFQDEINRACLAIVLASPRDAILSPVQGWNSSVNPLSDLNHSQISGARSLNSPYPEQVITKAIESKIARYASLIDRHPNILRAGIRRLLLAVTERMYPEDGFVDAVICWECFFSGTPETTLRVCGAMAKLLSPVGDERRGEKYRELQALYGLRNGIVHGSAHDVPEEIYQKNATWLSGMPSTPLRPSMRETICSPSPIRPYADECCCYDNDSISPLIVWRAYRPASFKASRVRCQGSRTRCVTPVPD